MKTECRAHLTAAFTRAALAIGLLPAGFASAQPAFQVGPLQVPPGQMRSGFLPVPPGKDETTRIPVSVFNGAAPGPVLAIIAGNHGYEYPPILATQRLLARINPAQLKGKVILVHVANLPSFLKRTVYYSPGDRENLNRVYPGKADGTISQRIAYVITREVIDRTDYLVDLHCGDGNESLRPYSYWMPVGNSKVDEAARQMVVAFGLPNIVIDRSRPKDAAASQYCSNTGTTRGKPSITVESGGMGVADNEEDIALLEKGALNLMRHLKMLDGPAQMPSQVTWYDPSEVLRFPTNLPEKEGLFYPKAKKGQMVEKGALLGVVTDFFGKTIHEMRAPFAGELLYIIGTPPISAGEPLGFVGAIKK
jgi:predicted deacylase